MSMKQARKLIEKLCDELDDAESDFEIAADERDDYEFQLGEKLEENELMEKEIRFLCQLLFDAKVPLPLEGHFTDINRYVPNSDPNKGNYEVDY